MTSFLNKVHARPFAEKPLNDAAFFGSDLEALKTTPPEIKARLLANENPFGKSPKAKSAIQNAIDLSYQYHHANRLLLEKKIMEHEGLQDEQVLLASGSSPLLLATALCYGKGTIV